MRFACRLLSLALALVAFTASGQTRTPVATDDFEAYTVGSFPGSNWTDLDNNNGQIRTVTGKGVNNAFSAWSTMRRSAGTYDTEQYAKGTVQAIVSGSPNSQDGVGVSVRNSADTSASGGQDAYAIYVDQNSTQSVKIARLTNNTINVLATQASTSVDSGDTISIEVTGTGATVTLNGYINDVLQASLTNVADTSGDRITAAGRPGIIGHTSGTSYMDDWEGGDITTAAAPTLSSPTPSGTLGTATTATIGATSDDSSGDDFYAVVDSAANLDAVTETQIKAGQNETGAAAVASCTAAVSTTSPSCGVTGLTAATGYSYSAVQDNATGDSNIVTGTFTTAAASSALLLRRRRD
jgi:hypothetical protein